MGRMEGQPVKALVILLVLASCGIQEVGGGAGLDLPWLGVVYECDATRTTPQELVELELCFDGGEDELEMSLDANGFEGATCWPTERHAGPCYWHCGGGAGCNAFGGCWCPTGET